MRVVIDTGVVVSALVFAEGELGWLRAAWRQGRLLPCVSRPTAAELLRVLAYPKFRLSATEREDLLADYLPFCHVVEVPTRGITVRDCLDAFDRPFLELAVASAAAALVTSDGDLLEVAPRFDVPVLRPAEWLARLDARVE